MLRPAEIVILLTVFGAGLRFATLDVQSAWLDESATIFLVHRGLAGLLSHLSASESAPPLYYVLVWAWTKVFGAGVLGFRSFSALIGTLTIPVMYAAGREVSPRVGVWAAALTTVSPVMYYYSQEARCYALLILFGAATVIYWQRAMRTPDRRTLALWSAMSVLALLTHYFAVFLFVPEAVFLLRRFGLRRVRIPIGAVLLTGIALVPLAVSQRANGKTGWIESTSLAARIAQAPKQFLVGLYGPLEIVTAALAGLLAAGTVVLVLRRGNPRERGAALDVAILGAGAIVLPALLSVTHVLDVFNGRNVIAAWSPSALFVAIGLGVARAGRLGTALGATLCAFSLLVIIAVNVKPGYQRDDWRGIATQLRPSAPGRIIVGPEDGSLPLGLYLPALVENTAARASTHELDFVALRTRRTGRTPLAPVIPTRPPAGFRLVSVKRTEAYAVARFIAARNVIVSATELRAAAADSTAEVIVQH